MEYAKPTLAGRSAPILWNDSSWLAEGDQAKTVKSWNGNGNPSAKPASNPVLPVNVGHSCDSDAWCRMDRCYILIFYGGGA